MAYSTVQTNDNDESLIDAFYDDYPLTTSVLTLFSPSSIKAVAIQWAIDPDDDKLIDGYTQGCPQNVA